MKIIGRNTARRPCVATIGFFDGVHLGHHFLINKVATEARHRNLASVIVTFSNHPLTIVRPGFHPMLITTTEEKERLLFESKADMTAVLDFTPQLALMSAKDFISTVLRDILNVQVLVIGYDHHFGHDKNEGFNDYVRYGIEAGIEVVKAEELAGETKQAISSSAIRKFLLQGDVLSANALLGYKYFIEGTVVGGFHIGRTIGYPTANIQVESADKLIPQDGVYIVHATLLPDKEHAGAQGIFGRTYTGMMNIGHRPTLANGSNRTIEVHLLDFSGDIYSKHVHIDFVGFIREEHRFGSIDQLRSQLKQDEAICRKYLL